ncbi:MAG: ABC transporter permease [Pseudomonadota bacterium]
MDLLDLVFSANFVAATIRIATPLLFGVLGALLCERAGVLNLGIEGIFVAGAFVGWMAVYAGAGPWGGVVAALAIGAVFGAIHAGLTVWLALSQHVSGLAITLFATSAAYFAYRTALPDVSSPPRVTPFQPMEFFETVPLVGPVLAQQTPMTLLAFLLAGLIAYALSRTPVGLAVRAVGDSAAAVEAQGLPVRPLRTGAVVAGSMLMALGGAFLTISAFDAFYFGMVNGRGWICIALVVFASWRPGRAVAGALLFGAFDAFQVRLQTQAGVALPGEVFLMLPYLLSILALILVARRADYPRALLKPYFRNDR